MDQATTTTTTPTRAWTVHYSSTDDGGAPRLIGVYLDDLLACEALDAHAEAQDQAGMPRWNLVEDPAEQRDLVAYWGGDPHRLVENSLWNHDDEAMTWIEEHLV